MDEQCLKKWMQMVLSEKKNIHTEIPCKIYKKYDEDTDKGYILKVDEGYPKRLHNFHNDLSAKIQIKKCHKFVCNLYDKNNYVARIRILKQALNYGLTLEKVHKVIQFNQENLA